MFIHNCKWGPPMCTPRMMWVHSLYPAPPPPSSEPAIQSAPAWCSSRQGAGLVPREHLPGGILQKLERCVRHSGEAVPTQAVPTEGATWGMGRGLRLHFPSEEPRPQGVCPGRRGKGWRGGGGSRQGTRICLVRPDGPMWHLGLASACISPCRGWTGRSTPHPHPRVLKLTWVLPPWEKGVDRADLEGGAHTVILGAPTSSASGWGGLGVGAGVCREGAICSDNWCWAAFTQQRGCPGRQYLKNSIETWGRGSSSGETAGLPRGGQPSQLPFFTPSRQK